ncbi:hypothetical protein BWR17_18505 (plasmid) [Phaeobacter inhibens]|uniref:hypothetical protein n=1 Tax=Phaeobacter inhibens TaxID=221822 RepID=UPI000971855A|nr:hypothetical protein [Phaeobacter inhibens]APX17880.1 hypothetical protein BWR17_18505 [Phaeobacter inhibens]
MRTILSCALALLLIAGSGLAQTAKTSDDQLDCEDERNAEEGECLVFIEPVAGQFSPMIAPAIGLLGLALVAGLGSSGSTSTTSTD